MPSRVENMVQTETGPRHVMQGAYLGARIEVVAGYDIGTDGWLVRSLSIMFVFG
jgi:hypothetical protein